MKDSSTFLAIIAFLFSLSVGFAQDSTEIIFEDPAFEAVVRERLQWSGLGNDQPITQNHLDGITFLWLDEAGEERVRSLNDLRHFTNLRSLEIRNASGITNFTPLWEVNSIRYLYVYGARDPDFSGISALSALQILDLSDCSLKNLDFLVSANLTELYSLILEANHLDLTEGSTSSVQIETLMKLVEGNRKTKIESGLYIEENGWGKLYLDAASFMMVDPWSAEPAVHYDMQIPKAVQNLNSEISRVDKILLENPDDPLANLLQGIHIFFNIAESNQKHGLKEFLISLGVEPRILSFTLADSSIAGNFAFELNRDFNSSLLANHMEEGIIPALVESESHFARIPVNSVITLKPEFTGTEETTSVDYADVLVLRSMVKILSAMASMQSAYDWNLNAGFVKDQDEEDANTTMQTFRTHNPNLLGIRNKEHLAKARGFLEDGIALYQIASPILTHESRLGHDGQPYPDRLFVIDSDSLEDERQFREDLDELLHALHEPRHLDSHYEGTGIIDLTQFFEGKVDLAQLLPASSGDRFATHQFRDPTFGGLFPRLNPKGLSTILFEEDLVLGQEPQRHDTLTEALKHFDPNAYLSLNQDLQAQYGANTGTALEHFKNFGYWEERRYFLWPFESVDFPISLTEPTVVNGQVVLLNGRLLSTGGSNSVKVGFAISSEGLLPRYDLGWEVHQSALNTQNGFSHAYQPLKNNFTYYYRAYAENEAGRWFGTVKKFKSAWVETEPNSIFGQSRSIGNGWYKNPWFGILHLPANGWSYHLDLGWIYLPDNKQEGVWLWSAQRQGWIWTKSDVWPHLWEHNERAWTYFRKIDNRPYFFNFKSASYE